MSLLNPLDPITGINDTEHFVAATMVKYFKGSFIQSMKQWKFVMCDENVMQSHVKWQSLFSENLLVILKLNKWQLSTNKW